MYRAAIFFDGVFEECQSCFKTHSTQKKVLKVFNDLLKVTDSGDSAILMLLDLTAAFDTIDLIILIIIETHCWY